MQRPAAVLLVVAAAVALATCRGTDAVGPAVPARVAAVSGNQLTGVAGHLLPQTLTVSVTATDGRGVADVPVQWTVVAGGGSLSLATASTDSIGRSSATLTLGPGAGVRRDTVTAAVHGFPPVVFAISVTPDAPAELVLISGDGQHAPAGQALGLPLVVLTRDQFGNATTGTGVTWAVTTGGGSVSALGAITDTLGHASVTWTLGTVIGLDSVTASAPGLTGSPVRFAASTDPGPVATLTILSGDGQVAAVAQTVTESLVVAAYDQFSNAVAGATVQWAAAPGSGSLSAMNVATDASGRAAVRWTLGTAVGPQHASATVSGAPDSPVQFDATAFPGPATALTFQVPPSTVMAGSTIAPAVLVGIIDAYGNTTAASLPIDLTLASNPGAGTLGGTTSVTASDGIATFSNLTIDRTGPGYTILVTAPGLTSTTSGPFDVIINDGFVHPVFTIQPSNGTAGSVGSPMVQIGFLDALGNLATNFTGNVTIALATNPGDGVLSGTLTSGAVGGVVTFSDLSIAKAGSGYQLMATSVGMPVAMSVLFDVQAGPAATLAFTTQPTTTPATSTIAPAIQVTAFDALGNVATGFTGAVTIAIAANPAGGTLSGGTTATASQGLASFPDLHIDKVGTGYTLQAQATGVTSITSASFDITTAASALLAFVAQPTSTTAGSAIAPAVRVAARDTLGNTVTSFTGNITITLGANPGSGTLSGTLTRPAVAGIATFNDLSLDKSGVGYVLTATSAALPTVSSNPFTITAASISASQSTVAASPATITASNGSSASTITVTARDAFGNRIAGAAVVLTSTGTGNTVTQPASPTNTNGVATGAVSASVAESKTVSASIGGVSVTQQATVVVNPAAASALAFTRQPTTTGAGSTINGGSGGVQVTARDPFGNTATGFSSGVTMALGANPGSGALSGTLTRSAVSGVATFTDLSINKSGTGYTLIATSNGVTQTTSATFNVTGGSVQVFAGNGQTGLKGFPLNVAPAVLVRDGANALLPNVQVTFQITGGTGSVTGANAVTDANGIATVGAWTVQLGGNTMSATVSGSGFSGNPVTFTATGVNSAYHIDVRFLTPMSPSRQAAFTNAAARWESLIFGDVPNISVDMPAGSCGSNSPRLKETVDDIVIYATVDSIDGPNNILGAAGPCGIRSSGKLPFSGAMLFDSADVAQLETDGQLGMVILHEMGHVLGYGTIWPDLNLLKSAGKTDSHFSGTTAIQAFDRSGGSSFSGSKVPVENCVGFPAGVCGAGTQDSHWRESVFGNELLTGYIDPGSNPLSVVTTASMGDLGYTMNYAASDAYAVVNPLAALRAAGASRPLMNDILPIPVVEVDASGVVVQVHPPR